jgi:hypothetical protein
VNVPHFLASEDELIFFDYNLNHWASSESYIAVARKIQHRSVVTMNEDDALFSAVVLLFGKSK